MVTKVCTKCKIELPATSYFFGPNKRAKDGFNSWCRECRRKYNREWHKTNNPIRRERYADDPVFREKELYRNKKRYQNDHEYHIKRQKQCRDYSNIYRKNNPDKVNAYRSMRRHKEQESLVILTQEEKLKVVRIFEITHEAGPDWQVDHIIPVSRGGTWHPDNLQIVLKSYNLQKGAKLENEFRPPFPFEIWNI